MGFVKIMFIAVFLFTGGWQAWGAMDGGLPATPPAKDDEVKKEQQGIKKGAAPLNQVRRITHLIQKIEGGVLYTSGGRYPLAGVKMVDFTRGREPAYGDRAPKKTAEMTFVNNELKEIIIRQRQ